MNEKIVQLTERRRLLTIRAAAQRLELAQSVQQLHKPLELADRALAVVRFIRSNPLLMASGGLLMTILRPKTGGLGKWVQRGMIVWQLFKKFRRR